MKQLLFIIIMVLNIILTHGQGDSTSYSFFVAGHVYGAPGVNNVGVHPPFKQKRV